MLFKEIKFKNRNISKEESGKIIGVLRFREGFYNYWQTYYRGEEVDFLMAIEEQCLTMNEVEDYRRVTTSNN